jgi:CHAT domain-containing protein
VDTASTELVERTIALGGAANVEAFLGRFATRLDDDLRESVRQSLGSSHHEHRVLGVVRVAIITCHGLDPEQGIHLSAATLQYLRERWKRPEFSNSDLLQVACASALNACVYANFLEGRWDVCVQLTGTAGKDFPFIASSPIFWNAVGVCAVTLIRRNRITEATDALELAPFLNHPQAPQLDLAWSLLRSFNHKRFEVDERPTTEAQSNAIWEAAFTSNLDALRRLRETLDLHGPNARVGLNLPELERLERKLASLRRIARQNMPFLEKYAILAVEQQRWHDEMTRFVNPKIDLHHVNTEWIARALNRASQMQATVRVDAELADALLVDLDTAHEWAVGIGDAHGAWMAKWAGLLMLEKLGRYDNCNRVVADLCHRIASARLGTADAETSSNIANFLPGLASKACKIHDQVGDPAVLVRALDLRRSRSLVACEADSKSGLTPLGSLNPLGPRTHYLGFTVLEHDDRIQAVLLTSDGRLSTQRIDLPMWVLREHAARLDPDQWSMLSFARDTRPLREALAPLLQPLSSALDLGRVQEGDHVCIAAEDPVNLIPLHYLPIHGKAAVSFFSMSRVASFSDAVQLSREVPVRPRFAKSIFVPSVSKNPSLQLSHYERLTDDLSSYVKECERIRDAPLTAAELLDCMAPESLIHVHAHGTFPKDRNPHLESGLVVSDGIGLPTADGDPTRLLTPAHILERRPNLRNSHVTLSACVSGLGIEGQGGDVLGMEMSLRLCGASSVLATHWNVLSEQAAIFAIEFYRRWLRDGLTRGDAWRRSIEFLMGREADSASAAHWCAFSLLGGWR